MARRESVPVPRTAKELLALFRRLPQEEGERFLVVVLGGWQHIAGLVDVSPEVANRNTLEALASLMKYRRTDDHTLRLVRDVLRLCRTEHITRREACDRVGLTYTNFKDQQRRYRDRGLLDE